MAEHELPIDTQAQLVLITHNLTEGLRATAKRCRELADACNEFTRTNDESSE